MVLFNLLFTFTVTNGTGRRIEDTVPFCPSNADNLKTKTILPLLIETGKEEKTKFLH